MGIMGSRQTEGETEKREWNGVVQAEEMCE